MCKNWTCTKTRTGRWQKWKLVCFLDEAMNNFHKVIAFLQHGIWKSLPVLNMIYNTQARKITSGQKWGPFEKWVRTGWCTGSKWIKYSLKNSNGLHNGTRNETGPFSWFPQAPGGLGSVTSQEAETTTPESHSTDGKSQITTKFIWNTSPSRSIWQQDARFKWWIRNWTEKK